MVRFLGLGVEIMKILYVTDLDGTLLTSQKEVSEYSKRIINELIDDGMIFTYATARSLSSASKVVNGVNFKAPIVAYNGAHIFHPQIGVRIASEGFAQDEIDNIKEIMEKYSLVPLVYSFIGEKETVSWVKGSETKGVLKYIDDRKTDKRMRGLNTSEKLYEGDVFYFTCIGAKAMFETAYQEFSKDERYRCMLQEEPYDKNEYWLEIMPKNASKANAILKLKELLGCDKVVSFGDAINDIPMFRISDECYAMENAVEELKAMATAVIKSNNEDGVAIWLKENVNSVLAKHK